MGGASVNGDTIPIFPHHAVIAINFAKILEKADDVLAIYSKIPEANANNSDCGGCITGTC
jgi:hypothetical protein